MVGTMVYYTLGDVVGYRSCWVGVEWLVGECLQHFCYIAQAVLDNDATTLVSLLDYDVLQLRNSFLERFSVFFLRVLQLWLRLYIPLTLGC